MQRYLINILIFFALIFVVDLCAGFMGDYLQAHAKGGDTLKTNNLALCDHHDILVFGSSRACHHYDSPFLSEAIGLDVYNAGYDGNGVVLSYGLLSIIMERYQPKLIIFDVEPAFDINVYSADNRHKRYIVLLKPYYQYPGVKEVMKDVSKEEWYKSFSGMMRYNTTIISKGLDYVKGCPDDNKGYQPIYGSYTVQSLNNKKDDTSKIDAFKLKYVEKMLLLAQSKNVPIMVVASPKFGMESSKVFQPVIELCNKYNVPFIDYYTDMDFMQHEEWFKEPMHLNKEGARIFSRRLINDIKNLEINKHIDSL